MSMELRQDLTLVGNEQTIQGIDSVKLKHYRSKVNLPVGNRFTIDAIDIVHNNYELELLGTDSQEVVRTTYVSCWPIAINNDPALVHAYGLYDSPTFGSRHDILYYQSEVCMLQPNELGIFTTTAQWPANELAGFPTMDFVTPHLYITVIYQLPDVAGVEESVKIVSPSVSMYAAYRQKAIKELSYVLGQINEKSTAMRIYSQQTGQYVKYIGLSVIGEWFPSWAFGGIRPSLFLTWGSGAEDYLDTSIEDGAEETDDIFAMRRDFERASATSGYDEIWGTYGASLPSTPDWVQFFGLQVVGIMADVTEKRIPMRRDDNGALRTFSGV